MHLYGKIFFFKNYYIGRLGRDRNSHFLFSLSHREKRKEEWTFPISVIHAVYFTPISYAGVNYRFVFSKLRLFD